MSAQVRLFAGAAEAVGTASASVTAPDVAGVLAELAQLGGPGTAQVLARCAVMVDGVRVADPATAVRAGAQVDVLPPFAGG